MLLVGILLLARMLALEHVLSAGIVAPNHAVVLQVLRFSGLLQRLRPLRMTLECRLRVFLRHQWMSRQR